MSEHRGALTAEGERFPSPRHALDYLDIEPPEPGHAVQLGEGLLWARIPLPMELNHINVWLLRQDMLNCSVTQLFPFQRGFFSLPFCG